MPEHVLLFFSDFLKVGVLLQLLVLAATLVIVPILFPFEL